MLDPMEGIVNGSVFPHGGGWLSRVEAQSGRCGGGGLGSAGGRRVGFYSVVYRGQSRWSRRRGRLGSAPAVTTVWVLLLMARQAIGIRGW